MVWVLLIYVIVLFPARCFANSMAPIFPLVSFEGWIAMPVIVPIEGWFYQRNKISSPYLLALKSNLMSALIGLIPAALTFWLMIGPYIGSTEPRETAIGTIFSFISLPVLLWSSFGTILGFVFHWWLSSTIEYKYASKKDLWKEQGLSKSVFLKANGITYILLFAVFGYQIVRNIIFFFEPL